MIKMMVAMMMPAMLSTGTRTVDCVQRSVKNIETNIHDAGWGSHAAKPAGFRTDLLE